MQNNNIHQPEWETEESGQGFDVHKMVSKMRYLWPWMLICVLVTASIAFVYLYFTPNQYKVNAKILIKDDDKKGGSGMGDMSMLKSMGLLSGASNVDNELEIIKSYTLMRQVVDDLQLNVQYFKKENLKSTELYGATVPFHVQFVSFKKNSFKEGSEQYKIIPTDKKASIVAENGKTFTAKWGDTLQLPTGTASVNLNPYVPYEKGASYSLVVSEPDAVTNGFVKNLQATIPNKQVSTIMLSMEQSIPAKGEQIINKLIQVYMTANVDDNNRIADSSMAFIDGRLLVVGDQLTNIEKEIQSFKQRNEISDLGEQAKAMISSTSEYAREVSQQEVQLSVIESLEKYVLDNSSNPRIVPASLVVQDPTLSAVVSQYNNLLMQRSRLLLGSTESNPVVINIDGQLKDLRQDLITGINSVKRGAQVALRSLRSNSNQLEAQMRQVPEKERVALDYSRQQNIRQELYLFLLQKREETAISRSSTIANSRILDAAKADNLPVQPKKKMVMALAVLAGLLLPFGVSYLRGILNTRLASKTDIETATNIPIVGEIGHSNSNEPVVVTHHSRAVVAEQFRALRTNLQYILPDKDDKVILITSSISGEGKSYVSTNLAAVLALTGKRVVLLELDLRKPKIASALNLKYAKGYSQYAIGKADLDDVIVPSGVNDNLFVIPAGPLPPNPTELLLNERTKDLFSHLKELFDYVIVDTTPNLVTDAQILSTYAQATLFIVRLNVTRKEQMRIPNAMYNDKKMPRLNLVVNDISQSKYGGGYYGYGYGYGYGAYAEDAQEKKWWKKA